MSGPWELESAGKRNVESGLEANGSQGQEEQEPVSSTACGEPEEEEETEEEEGSCCSEEGEDGSNIYFYYTIGERWIDYLQRTEDSGFLRHVRPKVTLLRVGVKGLCVTVVPVEAMGEKEVCLWEGCHPGAGMGALHVIYLQLVALERWCQWPTSHSSVLRCCCRWGCAWLALLWGPLGCFMGLQGSSVLVAGLDTPSAF